MTEEMEGKSEPTAKAEAPAQAEAPVKLEAPEPSHEDRVKALIAGYAHGLEHAAPRTSAELAEIKALLEG